jgi:DNA polymerase I-like protein with 3'-5' exonuclease and polymerase domains
MLLAYRAADKGITSFFNAYHSFKVKEGEGWAIHPNIRQFGKLTARLSCSDPNLQGLTDAAGGRSHSDVPARKPFGPRPGFLWFLFDYNQLEVRTFAAASRYDKLIDILKSDRDLHSEATNGIWGGKDNPRAIKAAQRALGTLPVPDRRQYEEKNRHEIGGSLDRAARKAAKEDNDVMKNIDPEKAKEWLASFDFDIVKAEASVGKKTSRNKGKPFFFTRMFGGGEKSISDKLHCSLEEARGLISDYDATLPGVIGFVRSMGQLGKKQGYVETLYGRVLDLKRGEEYKASPYIVQGTAADLVKRALVTCENYLQKLKIATGLLLQIHDELIFELPHDAAFSTIADLKRIVEAEGKRIDLEVPCKIKVVERYWSEAVDYAPAFVCNRCNVRHEGERIPSKCTACNGVEFRTTRI